MPESGFPSPTFSSVRFALAGFSSIDGNKLRSKLLDGGGTDVGQYNETCTHLIVDKLVYDDPLCVAARSSGKVVVTRSWVDHSFDVGMLVDAKSILYRPLKDLNGIPGAKSLVVCLTGYQHQDREDIMMMVDLMGGQFLKPLVANRVTHLICYKFEGEKYELAKRMKRAKLVNHRWLEDCLKNWKLLPEDDYEISGYDLEMMEASARDSEDEAEDASVKRANKSPLGLRVGAVAAVEVSKSGGKDVPVVQTNPVAPGGSSLCNTSKDNWLTPKTKSKPLETMVSTEALAPQQPNDQRASTLQNTSNHASPVPVNKTSEQGIGRLETDDSTAVNMSIRRHSSLATYSRKTLRKSPETFGNESTGQNGTLRMDDRGLEASTAFDFSASKSGSTVERRTLFEDFDKVDKLFGEETPPLLPQARITDGSASSKGSEKVHHNSAASIPPPASLLLQELRTGSPIENLKPMPSITDPTEIEEGGHKTPASVSNTKLLSSNVVVVPMDGAMSTAENIISKSALDELPERSSTELMVGNILLQEPRSGSPKQNLRVVPNISDHTDGREVEDMSDSAIRLFTSSVVPMEADTSGNFTLKGSLDEAPERSGTEPVMMRSSTSPRSGLTEMKDQLEAEMPKKNSAPRKSLGTRGRKKTPINQKGSIYLSEPTLKDERTDCSNKGKDSAPVTDNGYQKEISSPVLNTEAVSEVANHIESETEALKEIDSKDKKRKLQAKTPEKADAELEITTLEPELNDVPTKDPSDGALQSEVGKNKSKRTREATVGKNSLQRGKKESSSTAEVGKSSGKKTKKSRKEDDAKAKDTVLNDIGDNSAKEMENFALDGNSGKVSCGVDQSPVAGETSASKESDTKDPSDPAMPLVVDKNKGKRRKEATVGKSNLQSGKKRSSPTAEAGKTSAKKAKNSKKEDVAKTNDTEMNDTGINSAEVEENAAVDKKSGDVSSDGAQSPVAVEATVERSAKKGSSSTVKAGNSSVKKPKKRGAKASDTVMKDIGDNSGEEKENIAAENKSGAEKTLVSKKPLARKKAGTGTKAVSSKPLASRTVLEQEEKPKYFIVSGPKSQRKEFQQILRRLNGKCCRDSHQWSYQATHFVTPEIRRTEKFFAAAASGSWILKTDYVADSKEAGKLLAEEPYEWHSSEPSTDRAISLEAPRKWRLVKEQTGHGALYGLRIVVYGDCTNPSLDTLKRAVKAGGGTIVATAPPYTRFLNENTDFALISPAVSQDDVWIQEFIRHEIPCVSVDYIVEYVCKPGHPLDKHVLFNTHSWADRSFDKQQLRAQEIVEK
ncbi:unnamed protein product [Microthlaspi erraticum]|uniref:BRCT domain-containing protein n=1 Tax=Microthlaspi erraticum TaxID=1685480 RepID=A0A6D2HEN0_9BRAS|nr:unnamed protein product [Microthlaspi erraticum]